MKGDAPDFGFGGKPDNVLERLREMYPGFTITQDRLTGAWLALPNVHLIASTPEHLAALMDQMARVYGIPKERSS